MNKITIIGAGNVGSTIAYTLMITGSSSEIVMIDVHNEKAMGEALDIQQGTPYGGICQIYAGSYEDAKNSDIVIFTCGVARKPGQSRLDLAQVNTDITKSIIPHIVRAAPNAKYIIVSNPVDILTYVFLKRSGLPENQIIGSGTILDTARLRARLSECFNINQRNIHAYVLGEHGDSSFVPWSLTNISNVPVMEYHAAVRASDRPTPEFTTDGVEDYIRRSGGRIIERKGATFYAVSASVCHIAKTILTGIDTTMTVSTMMHGEYGINDVALSTLNIVGEQGAVGKVMLPLAGGEIVQLRNSAKTIKSVLSQLTI